ncbi:MAG: HAD family hydrolase [Candidatus Parabeggiatoa sp. nov. 2]|nr:MAG: hypothetical protein B6247_07545 [Beggiatoa sp. 4572_84]RKZ61703.1 MAG: HAD family hydrolase [Gammaproteobacteria bacterium]
MPLRAICFDLDDTLWPCEPVISHAEQVLYDWLSEHYPRLTQQFSIEALRSVRQRATEEHPHLRHDLVALRKLSLAQAAVLAGLSDSLVEPAFEIFMEARHQVDLYDDVLPILEKLRQRYILCALTNGNADVRRVGLGHLFDVALFAREIGAAKPHPALFNAACQYAKALPAQVVHVGDDAICDIAGASAVGMRTVWINRYQKIGYGALTPDATITSLTELESLLLLWDEA